jgi:hypothetical protein
LAEAVQEGGEVEPVDLVDEYSMGDKIENNYMREDLGKYLKMANFEELRVLTLSNPRIMQPIMFSWL